MKTRSSTVYGPVESWRLGLSLGIDLLYTNSICSFQCVYCQLGKINEHTTRRAIYAPTELVMDDLRQSCWPPVDVITFSGSGEPTLAANLGEVIHHARQLTGKPLIVMTNSAHLHQPEVRKALVAADRVFCKLDALDEQTLRWLNRPCSGITIEQIVGGIRSLRREFTGFLAIQIMLTHINRHRLIGLAEVLKRIGPDEVQLNSPLRSVPAEWNIDTRGGVHEGKLLKSLTEEEVLSFQANLAGSSGLRVVSRFQN